MQLFGINVDASNFEASLVEGVDKLIEAKVASAFPATTELKTLNASIEAVTATAKEVVDVYVTSKAMAAIGVLLDKIAAKHPVVANEVSALKSRLAAVGAIK